MSVYLRIAIFLIYLPIVFTQNGSEVTDSDKKLLLQFKSSVSDPEGVLSSWTTAAGGSDHCSWLGVTCDLGSRVVSLNISGQGSHSHSHSHSHRDRGNSRGNRNRNPFRLYGFGIRRNCSRSGAILSGNLPSLIGGFTKLRVLSLPFHGFNGYIPDEVWEMKSLEVLDLEGNLLTGSLPFLFSGLMRLRVLNLGFNMIAGEIPSSLSNCTKIETLNLAGNQMNGALPGFVGKFREVYLSFNSFKGNLPSDIGDFCGGKLEHLDLSANNFTGEIPFGLGNCSRLVSLLLYGNTLGGAIPAELGQLRKLEVLDVSKNSLSGPLPVNLGNCTSLSVLVLSNLCKVSTGINGTQGRNSSSLRGDFNYFQGGIPVQIIKLPKLKILWAPRATLEGMLPRNWGSCMNLEMVNLSQNFFAGKIPSGIGRCRKLRLLDLSFNRLTGHLMAELTVPCMTIFDVSRNSLSGSIPRFSNRTCPPDIFFNRFGPDSHGLPLAYISFFTNQAQIGIRKLFLGSNVGPAVYHNFRDNNLTGGLVSFPIARERLRSPVTGSLVSFPIVSERLRNQVSYAFFAGGNKLVGPLSKSVFGSCSGLDSLIINVRHNRLSGQMPSEIGKLCGSLKVLDASLNEISGPIPSSIGALISLVSLNLSSNQLVDQIPSSFGEIKYLKYLSLGNNTLNGTIPESFAQLRFLETLDLSSNHLTGEISEGLVNLENLTVLLLNNNNLSGMIPSGFANSTKLAVFNVSFNNLSGPLPSNNGSISCSSVLGNPNLYPCRAISLTVPSSDTYGSEGDPKSSASSPPKPKEWNSSFNSIEIASIASASVIVSVLIALIVLYLCTRRCNPKSRITSATRREVTLFTEDGVGITYDNVVRATRNFNASYLIGSGGFGATYKAEISSGLVVAIKRLSIGRFQGVQQFHAEIKTLGRLRHRHLVTLLGYHASDSEMFLIYNYLPGGNLEKFIQDRSAQTTNWRILHKIALDIARALAYLHDQCVPRVLHRDVKPSNILLDNDQNAYLSDFGLARLLGTSETHATTGVAGTFGYVAPEYALTCRVSDKSDVYSYGVVLLELFSDKEALDPSFASYGDAFNIVQWGGMLLARGDAKEFFTAGLWDAGPHDDLVDVLNLAVVCTVQTLSSRPTMKQVVRRLKQLQPPSGY